MPPNRFAVAVIIACTLASSATSTCCASEPGHNAAVWSAAAPSMSATQTDAPSSVKRIAASRPMPPPAPVMTHTLPCRRPAATAYTSVE